MDVAEWLRGLGLEQYTPAFHNNDIDDQVPAAADGRDLLEGNGFELPVPREIGSGFEASAELEPIDRRRGGIIRAVVGLGKPIELLRRLEEPSFAAA
jgi:hypothetical protein